MIVGAEEGRKMTVTSIEDRVWDQGYRQEIAQQLCRANASPDIIVSEEQGYALLPKGTAEGSPTIP